MKTFGLFVLLLTACSSGSSSGESSLTAYEAYSTYIDPTLCAKAKECQPALFAKVNPKDVQGCVNDYLVLSDTFADPGWRDKPAPCDATEMQRCATAYKPLACLTKSTSKNAFDPMGYLPKSADAACSKCGYN
jgi:hypothetical protein